MLTNANKIGGGKSRNSNIELLRFVLMFFIFAWHVLVHAYGIKNGASSSPSVFQLALCSLFVPSVNAFMLISGYYGLKLTFGKAISFVIQACFYSYGFLFFKMFTVGLDNDDILGLAPISTFRWWFFTYYFMILLLSPVINAGIEKLGKKQFKVLLICLVVMNFGLWLAGTHRGYDFHSLLIIYLLGRYLNIYGVSVGRQKAAMLWGIATLALWLSVVYAYANHLSISFHLLSYNNVLIIMQAIGIVFFALSFKERHFRPFLFLGVHSFAIYLITERTAGKIYQYAKALFEDSNFLYGLAFMLLVMLACVAIDAFQSKINAFIVNKVSNKG